MDVATITTTTTNATMYQQHHSTFAIGFTTILKYFTLKVLINGFITLNFTTTTLLLCFDL